MRAEDGDFKKVSLVIDLMLSLPPTSVSCETSFSQMKLIKTSRRTRLRSSTLNDLLVVKLESADVGSFSPDEAIDKWLATSLGQRRPTYIRQKTIKDQTVTEDATQSESDSNGAAEDDNDEPDSDAEIEYLNVLCGDEPDIDCYDFQDEEDNFDKILIYARES